MQRSPLSSRPRCDFKQSCTTATSRALGVADWPTLKLGDSAITVARISAALAGHARISYPTSARVVD
jgi:hypothetical protein